MERYGNDDGYGGGGYSRGGGRGGYNSGSGGGSKVKAQFDIDDYVAVKMRGLPYQVRYEDVSQFFREFNIIDRSVVLGKGHDGRKNGFGAILFESESEAKAAMQAMQGKHIGTRYVELSVISYGDYRNFNGPSYGGTVVKLSKYVSQSNKDQCLVMRGLPYRVKEDEIQKFFDGYGNVRAEDIFIEEFNGKRTGSALVIFENHDVAQDAKAALNKKEIDGRYVELFDCEDQFMRKICNLFDE